MSKTVLFCLLVVLLVVTSTSAANKVVVVPLGGAIGNATSSDVVKGKTFSSNAGKGLAGTLELSPIAQNYTNSVGMTFNLLPAGTFIMGSPGDEPGGPYTEEQPQHQVTLTKSFYMQTTEVTNKHWNTLIIDYTGIGTNPSAPYNSGDRPVINVTWFEAALFANMLSVWEGRSECYQLTGCSGGMGAGRTCTEVNTNPGCTGYRLPTEAEWEYAVRATTTTAWAYAESYDSSADPGQVTGEGFNSNLDAIGWYDFNRTTQYADGTKPVAKKQANKWGLYDMAGNVWEWCQDWYDSTYYSDSASGTDPQGANTGSNRVIRGGGWSDGARFARSADRDWSAPGIRNVSLGFRLALPPGQ